jgi:hypothetical protein
MKILWWTRHEFCDVRGLLGWWNALFRDRESDAIALGGITPFRNNSALDLKGVI